MPVFTSNEDYAERGSAPADERAALQRIRQEGLRKRLSVGTVHVFLLAPDGSLLDTMHVASVNPGTLAERLERQAKALGTRGGAPVIRPCPPAAPEAEPGTLRLHLTARYLERRGDALVLVENAGGNWSALPGEDWILLGGEEQALLLPLDRTPSVGRSWKVDRQVVARLLRRFYPPTENNDLAKNVIEEQTLRAVVTSVGRGTATARLEGRFRMKHPFYHRDDEKYVAGDVVGYLGFDPHPQAGTRRAVRSLRMVTDRADYGGPGGGRLPFGVALRSAP